MNEAPAQTTSRSITVLIVDHDLAFARTAQEHLREFQGRTFQVLWKETVEAAVAEVQQNPGIDIIITESALPGTTGLEFCLQLHQLGFRIPIVFISSTRNIKVAVEAMKLGVEDFLVKEDLTEFLLARTILSVLERVERREQMKFLERRMLIAQKRAEAIRELVVTVCHEFNNPLAAIKISMDLLHRQPLGKDAKNHLAKFDKHFQKIEKEIKRLRDINFERFTVGDAEALAARGKSASGKAPRAGKSEN
jgi:FixJ family two-component response regulator